jgi:hypothetical protein
MKKFKNLIFFVGGLISIGLVMATLNIQTSLENAFIYVKTIFVTNDGTPTGTPNIILS